MSEQLSAEIDVCNDIGTEQDIQTYFDWVLTDSKKKIKAAVDQQAHHDLMATKYD